MKQMKNSLLLLLTATIWGCAFVAQSVSMDYIGPFSFTAIRSIIGSIVLVPVILVMGKGKEKETKEEKRILWTGGIICGIIMFVATNLQQIGLMGATVGKAGFITALYIVILPILGLFIGRKSSGKLWFCVALSLIGLYLLCMKSSSLSLNSSDIMLLLCAFSFSIHILVVDHYSPKVNGVKLSSIQFLVCGILSAIPMFAMEHPQLASVQAAWLPIAYAGIMSCGVAYTLQIISQKNLNPVVASLIMSLESVISALAGWVLLGQKLSAREISGCVLMFVAIIITQLPERAHARK